MNILQYARTNNRMKICVVNNKAMINGRLQGIREQRHCTCLHVIESQVDISIILCFDDMLQSYDIIMSTQRL